MTVTAMLSTVPAAAAPTDADLATPGFSASDKAPDASLNDSFFTYSRDAEYNVVREDVRVPVRGR